MPASKKREKIKLFGELLKGTLRRSKSKGTNPTSHPASSHPQPSPPSGSTISASPSAGKTSGSQSTPPGPARAVGAQSLNPIAPAPAPAPAKNEAFEKAVKSYINQLTEADKKAFLSGSDIMARLQEMQNDQSGFGRVSGQFTPRIQKVLQCIKQFMGSIAISIQHHPEISSLVLGGFNCILTLALGYMEFFESLTDMMERIGEHLSYLSEYATDAFQKSAKIQQVLVSVYCDLLEFYVKVRDIFANRDGKRSYARGFKLFLRLTWEPFEVQFQSIEARFIHHVDVIVRQADVEHKMHYYRKEIQSDRRLEDERRRVILEWLSSDDFEDTHQKHFKKRFGNTGQWLLDDLRFTRWRDEMQSSLLWCHGAPGSGKTVLASLVIEHLSSLYLLSSDTGMTFVYCNYNESRSPETYIRLALKQLCRRMPRLPVALHEFYEKHFRNCSQPDHKELQRAFLAIVRQFKSVFLVLDALDECTLEQRIGLYEFFSGVTGCSATSAGHGIVKLFVTSRKGSDIERAFHQQSFPTIEIEATKVDSDIKIYVEAQIEQRLQDGQLTLRNMALKDRILTALTTKAGGMFLWVEFQLREISEQISDYAIEQVLGNMPEDMDATYERILDEINRKPQVQRELARKVLIYIAYARSRVSIDVLTHIVSIRKDIGNIKALKSSTPTEKILLDTCVNLISVDSSSKYVRFVHFSVQEFLTSHQSPVIETLHLEHDMAHREIASMCMSFLLLLYSQPLSDGKNMEVQFQRLLDALNEWPHHLLAGNLNCLPMDDKMVTLTSSFLEKSPPMIGPRDHFQTYFRFSPSAGALIFNLPGVHQRYEPWPLVLRGKQLEQEQLGGIHDSFNQFIIISDNRFIMHYTTSVLDTVPVAQRLYTHGYPMDHIYCATDKPQPIFQSSVSSSKAFPIRCIGMCILPPLYSVQSEDMAMYLLSQGASVKPKPKGSIDSFDSLTFFAKKGYTKVVQLLLDRAIDFHGGSCDAALRNAAAEPNCNIDTLQLLIDKGADVNAQGGEYAHALQAAASQGNIDAVQLLLDKGANVNSQGGVYGNALQAAVFRCRVEAVELLLDKGADIDAQSRDGNALQAAASCGNVDAMRLFLDRGVNVNSQGGENGSALQAAALGGQIEAIKVLLDKGANVNAQGGRYGNALGAAAFKAQVEAVRVLLDNGADINAQAGDYVNALQAAAFCGNVETIQLLLDNGADVNAEGGKYGNALQTAAFSGRAEAIQILLDKGANIDAQGGEWGGALQTAASRGNVKAIQTLLDRGANPNTHGGKYGNALQGAIYRGNRAVIQLLLENGADINAQGGQHGNALQAVAYYGDISSIQLLLDNGADIDAPGGKYGNALQAAAYQGRYEIVQLLLDKGADINVQHGIFGTALHAASYACRLKVTNLLLEKGVDVNAQGGKYGTALQAALTTISKDDLNRSTKQKVSSDIFPVVELLLDHGADITAYVPNSEGGDALTAAKLLWKDDNDTLAQFMKLLKSRGWKEGESDENGKEPMDGKESVDGKEPISGQNPASENKPLDRSGPAEGLGV